MVFIMAISSWKQKIYKSLLTVALKKTQHWDINLTKPVPHLHAKHCKMLRKNIKEELIHEETYRAHVFKDNTVTQYVSN